MPENVRRIRTERRNPKEVAELVEKAEKRRQETVQEIAKSWRKIRESPPPIPVTPCCGNCANWQPPANPKKEHFGECQVLVVIHPGNKFDKTDTWHVDDERLRRAAIPPAEPMRTGSLYEGCRAYERKAAA